MLNVKSMAALFAFLMGVAILAMWGILLAAGQTPELDATPVRFALHLVAEFLTAVACLVAGYGLICGRPWGWSLYLVASGLLLYAVIQAAGYFMTKGDAPFTVLFLSFAGVALAILWRWMQPRGPHWLLLFLGMVLYATVQTTGYFAQQGELVATMMFGVLILFTLVSVFTLLKPVMAAIQISR